MMRLTALYNDTAAPRDSINYQTSSPWETQTKVDNSQTFTLRQLLLQKEEREDYKEDGVVKLPKLNVVRIEVSVVMFFFHFCIR